MPTYEYLCQSCGARFEAWQKITDDPIDVCPTCGEHVRRIIFPVGLVFKGSGFYVNDTRSATSRAVDSGEPGSGQGSDTPAGETSPSPSAEAKDASSVASKTASSGTSDAGGSGAKESPKSSQAATTSTSSTSGSSSGD
jgi:putative FmdB family regulatory protein